MKKLLLSLFAVFSVSLSAHADFSIEFLKGNSNASGSAISSSTNVTDVVTSNSGSYVTGTFTEATRAYSESSGGLKLGTANGTGLVAFSLSDAGKKTIKGVKIKAASFSSSDVNVTVKLTINGSTTLNTNTLSATVEEQEVLLASGSSVAMESIKIESTGTQSKKSRAYVESITFIEDVTGPVTPVVLGDIVATCGTTVFEDNGVYENLVEGDVLTFSCENAETITVTNSESETIASNTAGSECSWTATPTEAEELTVTATLGETSKSITFMIAVADNSVNPGPTPVNSVEDILNGAVFSIKTTVYKEYQYTGEITGITYSGFMNGAYPNGVSQSNVTDYFGIRAAGTSNDNNSFGGIAVTKNESGKKAVNVTVTQWTDQASAQTRKVFVYGSNIAYSAGKGINSSNIPDGSVKLGEATMQKGTPVTITLDEKYPYICIFSDGTLQVEKIVVGWAESPAYPTAQVDDAAYDSDEAISLDGKEKVVVTLEHADSENHAIFYKFVGQAASAAQAEDNNDGFTEYSEPIVIKEAGTLQYYAQHKTSGVKSETRSISFTGVTTSVSEIEVAGVEAEYYDLSGRRIEAPVKGIVIKKTGSKVSKYVF